MRIVTPRGHGCSLDELGRGGTGGGAESGERGDRRGVAHHGAGAVAGHPRPLRAADVGEHALGAVSGHLEDGGRSLREDGLVVDVRVALVREQERTAVPGVAEERRHLVCRGHRARRVVRTVDPDQAGGGPHIVGNIAGLHDEVAFEHDGMDTGSGEPGAALVDRITG